uniref:EamA domain-containing protein n=1 Tax=Chenopodium quinoa TaxID=63459 RepID=A0A803LJN9_CHEQI
MDPATFNVVRFSLSAIPFLPATLGARNDAHICKAGAELGLWVSLAYLLQAFGLLTSDAGRASFISMIGVIVIPLLGEMFGSVIPPLTWFGAIMSVVGVTMLECSGSPPSVCVVAVSSITWFLFEGWFDESHRPWTWELFWASWVSFPWIPAIYTGVFSGICLWVEMATAQEVSATEAAIIYRLEPIWGAGFAWFFLGERWGIYGWIGAALVLGGSLIAQTFGSLSSTDSGDSEQ